MEFAQRPSQPGPADPAARRDGRLLCDRRTAPPSGLPADSDLDRDHSSVPDVVRRPEDALLSALCHTPVLGVVCHRGALAVDAAAAMARRTTRRGSAPGPVTGGAHARRRTAESKDLGVPSCGPIYTGPLHTGDIHHG